MTEFHSLLKQVRMFAMDIDGVLTDGSIIYGNNGDEYKRFHVQDGLGIAAAARLGITLAWITGRSHEGSVRRARELRVKHIVQEVSDKVLVLKELCEAEGIPPFEVLYMGDDWNDIAALQFAGVSAAPANAVPEVRKRVHYTTACCGGHGAVREVCEALFTAQGKMKEALSFYEKLPEGWGRN